MANSNSNSGGVLVKLLNSLENKLILLLMAGLLGVSGNQVLQVLNPEVIRPDPWTGTQAREAHDDIRRYVDTRWELMNNHIEEAKQGYSRIRKLEQQIKKLETQVERNDRDLNRLLFSDVSLYNGEE